MLFILDGLQSAQVREPGRFPQYLPTLCRPLTLGPQLPIKEMPDFGLFG